VAAIVGALVDAAAGAAAAPAVGVPDAVAVAAPPPAAPLPPRPSGHHWHATGDGWRGCLPASVRTDAVALAVGVLGRIGGEDGLLSLEVREVGGPFWTAARVERRVKVAAAGSGCDARNRRRRWWGVDR